MDISKVREDFPILRRRIGSRPLVYLDNAATSQKPRQVIEAISNYYLSANANVHRGSHTLSNEASQEWEDARSKIARFIGASSPDELIFTRNATESINLIAYSLFKTFIRTGDHIVVTKMEHHSNFVPWQQLGAEKGVKVSYAGITRDGQIDIEDFRRLVSQKAKVVAFTHCSNILGTITPVKELTEIAKEHGALVLIDGCQAVPHLKVNVEDIGCDFYAFSGHKMLGPTGIGVLWGRKELLEEVPPFLFGGDMISTVSLECTTFNTVPRRFEAGTPNVAGGIGLGAAVGYLDSLGMENVRAHEKMLLQYAIEQLGGISGVTLYGPSNLEERSGVLSFNLEGVHPHDISQVLDTIGVAVRSGDHCGQPLMKELGIKGAARASFYVYNTLEEVDTLAEGVRKVKKLFG